jgi:hypothetical protein
LFATEEPRHDKFIQGGYTDHHHWGSDKLFLADYTEYLDLVTQKQKYIQFENTTFCFQNTKQQRKSKFPVVLHAIYHHQAFLELVNINARKENCTPHSDSIYFTS